jgi:hypothetical protein
VEEKKIRIERGGRKECRGKEKEGRVEEEREGREGGGRERRKGGWRKCPR